MIYLKKGLTGLKPVELVEKATTLVAKMTGNANFPTPTPDLAVITAKKDELVNLITESGRGDRDKIAARRLVYRELKSLLGQLAAYVGFTANGDELIIRSSGFDVAQPVMRVVQVTRPQKLIAVRGEKPGEVELNWARVPGTRLYQVEQTEQDPSLPETEWATVGLLSRSRLILQGLVTPRHYWYRVKAVGSQNESPFSDVALVLAA